MEVDDVRITNMDTSSQSNISITIHPLVLVTISEHYMRYKLIEDSADVFVYGGLLGKHSGCNVEIHNIFELVVDDRATIDMEYFFDRIDKVRQLYKGLDVIGWYSNGKSLTVHHKNFHFQFIEKCECSYVLILDPLDKTCERLPFRLYEAGIDNLCQVDFKQVMFVVGNDPIESIGIDLLARVADATETDIEPTKAKIPPELVPSSPQMCKNASETMETLMENQQAVQMLANRLNVLRDYVDAVIRGDLPINHARLREIKALLVRIPHAATPSASRGPFGDSANPHNGSNPEDQNALLRQASDVCLTSLLAGLTRTMQSLHSWLQVEKQLGSSCKNPLRG